MNTTAVRHSSPQEIMQRLERMKRLRDKLAGTKLTDQEEEEKARCEESLSYFLQRAWRYIDPAPYKHNWHIDLVCEHLEAVIHGDIRHLLINVPPRTAKSSMTAVSLVPWAWTQQKIGPLSGPQLTSLYTSYAQTLSFRDSAKARRLIQSPWYQKLWGNYYQLAGDQNTKSRFDNSKGGYRIATSTTGGLTGEGGQLIVCDDAHNSIEAESELVRQGVLDWWDSSLSTRHNDPKTGAYIVVMQRLHESDLAGHILDKWSDDWTHLMLPMRYEHDRHCVTVIGEDPRTIDGELLWPSRAGEDEVAALERSLGPYAAAGQLQQSPQPKGGGIVKIEWIDIWKDDNKEYPVMDFVLASLDPAYTEDQENDYSALTVWGVYRNEYGLPRIMLMYGWQDRLDINPLVNKVAADCGRYHVNRLLIENKASGKSVIQELRRLFGFEQFGIQAIEPKGDKVARMYSIQHVFSEGFVCAPDRKWADIILDQLTRFPKVKNDDLSDSVSQAIKWLRDNGFLMRKPEQDQDFAERFTPHGKKEALYDV